MEGVIFCDSLDRLAELMFSVPESAGAQVLVVRRFLSREAAARVYAAFPSEILSGGSSIYGSSATPLYEYREDVPNCLNGYLDEAQENWLTHRARLAAAGDPVSEFMVQLSRAADVEVRRLELQGKPCFFGQYRCFGESDIEPHVDVIEREFPSLMESPLRQWALNIATRSPELGGELDVWDKIPSYDEYRGYGLGRPAGDPAVTFKPVTGDLYVFQPKYVHSIRASQGARCALAGFVAAWDDKTVHVWS